MTSKMFKSIPIVQESSKACRERGFVSRSHNENEEDDELFDRMVDEVLDYKPSLEEEFVELMLGKNAKGASFSNETQHNSFPSQEPNSGRYSDQPQKLLPTLFNQISSPLIDNLCNNEDPECVSSNLQVFCDTHEQTQVVQLSLEDPLAQQQLQQKQETILFKKPKRNLSAYNFFFQAERQKLLELLPSRESQGKRTPRNSHGKLGFAAMARFISAKWKTITPEEKSPYDSLAEQDTLRYKREMAAWKRQAATVESTLWVGQALDGYTTWT